MAESQEFINRELRKLGLKRVNEPMWTPDQFSKAVVLAKYINGFTGRQELKLIRFGKWGQPHNHSAEARQAWIHRHGHKRRQGRSSVAYWEYYYLWAPGADVCPVGDNNFRKGIMAKGRKIA